MIERLINKYIHTTREDQKLKVLSWLPLFMQTDEVKDALDKLQHTYHSEPEDVWRKRYVNTYEILYHAKFHKVTPRNFME